MWIPERDQMIERTDGPSAVRVARWPWWWEVAEVRLVVWWRHFGVPDVRPPSWCVVV